jgi:uncharacterized protein (TIGR02217 family)
MSFPYVPARYPIATAFGSDDSSAFPLLAGQTFIMSKRPIFVSKIAESTSGRERRRRLWSYPKWGFKVAYEVLRDAPAYLEIQRLSAFFLLHGGRSTTFNFLDPSDNTVTAEPFATGDGVTTTFQLTRSLTFGADRFIEPVRMTVGVPTVFIAGAATSAFTQGANGSITFATAPTAGATLTWTGLFMFVCRFDQDDLDMTQMMSGLWSQSGLAFQTVKL